MQCGGDAVAYVSDMPGERDAFQCLVQKKIATVQLSELQCYPDNL